MADRKTINRIILILLIVLAVFSCKNDLMDVLESPEISITLDGKDISLKESIRIADLELGTSREHTLKITNRGQKGSLELTGDNPVLVTGTYASMFSISGLEELEKVVIEPRKSLTLKLIFYPVGSLGEKDVRIDIETNDSDEGTFYFTVTGKAVVSTSDDTGPGVVLSTAETDPTNTSPIPVTAVFSEEVVGFDRNMITVSGGVVDNLDTTGNPTFTFDITNPVEGEVTAYIASGVVNDIYGNSNSASEELAITYDETAPTVEIESAGGNYKGEQPFNVTITFSEEVEGFTASDISLDFVEDGIEGSVTALTTDDYIEYTAEISLDGSAPWITDINIDIPSGACTDLAGNPSAAADQFVIIFNSDAPTVTITTGSTFTREISGVNLVTQNSPSAGTEEFVTTEVTEVTVTFSQEIVDLGAGNISMEGGANFDNLQTSTPNLVYSFEVTLDEDPDSVYFWIQSGEVSAVGSTAKNLASELCMITRDSTVPTGTMEIDALDVAGNKYTNYTTVDLAFTADGTGTDPYEMMISNAADFSGASWEDWAATKEDWIIDDSETWNVETNPADISRTIYWKVRDQAGNESIDHPDDIIQTPDGYFDISHFADVDGEDVIVHSLFQ